MNSTADVVVMGGGIVGAACADALSADGLRVHLLEASVIGGGATAAGMGHLVVLDDSEPQFALSSLSLSLWEALAPELPPEVERSACGTLWVAADEEEMGEVHRKHAFYNARGVASEVLDARQVAEAEPQLRPGLAGGLEVPGDRVIYAPCAAAWLAARARGRGAVVKEGVRAQYEGEGTVRLSDGTHISAAHVIDATGVNAATEVRPRKGHLAITDRYPGFVRHQLIELGYLKSAHGHDNESVAFNVQPRPTGQILIGSSRQYGIEHSRIDAPFLARMLRRAIEYMPRLADVSIIRTWTGFRAATPDGLPLIGPSRHDPRLLLATGHEGLGITTSLGTARLLADFIAGRPSAIPLAPYLPERLHA
jgi:D-hydroxyproline dehydrogenase subunit beta